MSNSVPILDFQEIKFLGSFPKESMTPKSSLPEFAFIGRSNVGKSSIINYLCDRRKLAKTSGTPGKTQLIVLFEIADKWNIADLPGYGYARISKKQRAKWSTMIQDYLMNRENLATVFILIDSRVTTMQSDLDRIEWLGEHKIPFALIFTKADKLKPKEIEKNIGALMKNIQSSYQSTPNYFITSSSKRIGRNDVLDYINYVIENN